MQSSANGRSPNGRSSVYLGKDGYWHGRVTMGVRDDGRPDRRHVQARSRAEVTGKVSRLEKERDSGQIRKPGQRWTVAGWLTHWVDAIAAPPAISDNAQDGYRVDIYRHLIPGVGAHRLEKLEPEHLERLYARMQRAGLKPGTAHHVHRTIRAALNEAVRRRHLAANPALLAKAPAASDEEIEPYDVREIQRILETARKRRNSARWAVALALGLRQGETLGLKWSDIDLDKGIMRIRRAAVRPRYAHGCGNTCGRKPGYCPRRRSIRAATGDVKSRAGRRVVGLPVQLADLLRGHREEQRAERTAARQLWHDGDWVFATPTGERLNYRTDHKEWKDLLAAAGVRDARLHDARHTAATMLLILGVPNRTAMSVMGWSSAEMAARYQHVTDAVRSDVAEQVGALIWAAHAGGDRGPTVTVPREALASVLALAEAGLGGGSPDPLAVVGVTAAIGELRAALMADGSDDRDL
jgi:integrase